MTSWDVINQVQAVDERYKNGMSILQYYIYAYATMINVNYIIVCMHVKVAFEFNIMPADRIRGCIDTVNTHFHTASRHMFTIRPRTDITPCK